MRNVRVAIWGFGAMGQGMAAMILKKKGIEITGICNRSRYVGEEMHNILGIKRTAHSEIVVTNKIEEIIKNGNVDVALLCTDSFTKQAFDKIKYCLENKVDVVSSAEEFAYPAAQNPELTKELDKIAKANGKTVLGTGINPGFVLDTLIIALTGTCEEVTSIKAARINDLSPFGKVVMEEQGVGISVEEFTKRNGEGHLAGHVGFPESITMIADAIGWKLEKVDQSKDPIISNVERVHAWAKVVPGSLAGIRQQGFGYVDGEVKIYMDHPQQIYPQLENKSTGDYITITGTPNINLQITPEIPGGIGTIAMCVNMIPQTINADPGVVTMLDVPMPRAIMGDFRDLIKRELN